MSLKIAEFPQNSHIVVGLIKAYKYASALQVGVYQYTSSVVFVAIIEWSIWSRTPGLLDYIGFALVTIAGVFSIPSSGQKTKS